jgi:hypothetical protein
MPQPRSGNAFAYILLGGMVAILLFFGLLIIARQMETGTTYPEYSTFRTDPKGLKALYDSLDSTGDIHLSRLTAFTKREISGEGRVMFMAGVNPNGFLGTSESAGMLNAWLASGGRLVIALNASGKPPAALSELLQNGPHEALVSWREFIERWGATVEALWIPQPFRASSPQFGDFRHWFGQQFFDKLGTNWKPLVYAPSNKHEAVVVERSVGAGSLVLLNDSYPISNEALSIDRNTPFLLWLLNDRNEVIFSEIQLGIDQKPGIMTLANRYGLQGLLIGLVLTALLFVWKSQYSLIPKFRENPHSDLVVEGRSADEAFITLLRRTVKEKNLLSVCLDAWKRTAKPVPEQTKTIDALLQMRSGSLVQQYVEIDQLLKGRSPQSAAREDRIK